MDQPEFEGLVGRRAILDAISAIGTAEGITQKYENLIACIQPEEVRHYVLSIMGQEGRKWSQICKEDILRGRIKLTAPLKPLSDFDELMWIHPESARVLRAPQDFPELVSAMNGDTTNTYWGLLAQLVNRDPRESNPRPWKDHVTTAVDQFLRGGLFGGEIADAMFKNILDAGEAADTAALAKGMAKTFTDRPNGFDRPATLSTNNPDLQTLRLNIADMGLAPYNLARDMDLIEMASPRARKRSIRTWNGWI